MTIVMRFLRAFSRAGCWGKNMKKSQNVFCCRIDGTGAVDGGEMGLVCRTWT